MDKDLHGPDLHERRFAGVKITRDAAITNNHLRRKGFANMKAPLLKFWALTVLFAGPSLCTPVQGQAPYRFDAATVSGLPARNIGSATMSGRVAAVDAIDQDGRITVYVGSASGGVWKSVNGGTPYKSVFDPHTLPPIRALTPDPSHPKTISAVPC